MVLQQTIREHQLPVIILFEGWSFSGKGTFISELMINFDFRHLTMHNVTPPTEEEMRHPFYGAIGICFRKRRNIYFGLQLVSRYFGVSSLNQADEDKIKERTKEILQFERTLHDAGYIIIKFFLHIDDKTLKAGLMVWKIIVQPDGVLLKKKKNNIINIIIAIKSIKICWNPLTPKLLHGMW